jgi:hypothetical protein
LEAADCFEGIRVMNHVRLPQVRRPSDGQYIEPGGSSEETVLLQEMQSEVGQSLLLGLVNRLGGASGVSRFRGAHLDEDDAVSVECHKVKLTMRACVIASNDAIAEVLQEACRRPFASRAEPAPPPWAACLWFLGHCTMTYAG